MRAARAPAPASARLGPALLLAACTVGPDYEPPPPGAPEAWAGELGAGLSAAAADLRQWWQRLGDPALDGLVARAAAANLDLRAAAARLAEARALRAVAAGGRWPTLDGFAAYTRSARSARTDLGNFGVLRDDDVFAVGIDAAWEIDLWGRLSRGVEAADADLEAAVADGRAALVTVVAEVALGYVELRSFQERLRIAGQNVALQEQTRDLVASRRGAGLASGRELAQAETELASTRAALPALAAGARAAEYRLAVLLGEPPGALAGELREPAALPVAPLEVAVGVPAAALLRRPDVRGAERRLAAATARIGVAEALRYPRLTLLGSIGFQANRVEDLFHSDANVFSVGPSLVGSLFDGGVRSAAVAAADARAQEAAAALEQTVLFALEEVETAMVAFVQEQARRRELVAAVESAREAVRLADIEYRAGLTDFQSVLDAQRELAELEDRLAQSAAAVTSEFVLLYKALGGGWEHLDAPALAQDPARPAGG